MGSAKYDSGQVGDQRPTYMPETRGWFPPSPQQVSRWLLKHYIGILCHISFSPWEKKSPGIHHPQFLSFLRNALVFFLAPPWSLSGSYFPTRDWTQSWQRKHQVLTTGQPGNSQELLWNHFSLVVYFTTSTGELRHSPSLNYEISVLA